eukprot:5062408-Amphidinium_carterae.1
MRTSNKVPAAASHKRDPWCTYWACHGGVPPVAELCGAVAYGMPRSACTLHLAKRPHHSAACHAKGEGAAALAATDQLQ